MSSASKRRRWWWTGLLALAGLILIGGALTIIEQLCYPDTGVPRMDPRDEQQVAVGRQIYDRSCMACHGADLEGQPNWREWLPSGRLPAPPHDETGHTWHHSDRILFGITKYGMIPPYAPPGHESDMPAFKDELTDEEIAAVLAYIKSTWSREVLEYQREVERRDRQQR